MKKSILLSSLLVLVTTVTFSVKGLVTPTEPDNTAQSEVPISSHTASFYIEGMTCALCPVTVSKAIRSVDGVSDVSIDYEAKTAIVAFSPELTTIEIIGAASIESGYPAVLIDSKPAKI